MKKVRIIYKSGAQIDVKCSKFSVTRNAQGELTKAEWDDITPRPLALGIEEIAAVWEMS